MKSSNSDIEREPLSLNSENEFEEEIAKMDTSDDLSCTDTDTANQKNTKKKRIAKKLKYS